MKKKILSIILVLCMVVSLLPALGTTALADSTVWDGSKEAFSLQDAGSANSAVNPYIIDTAEKLAKLSEDVKNGQTYELKYLKITADIILNVNASNYENWGDAAPTNAWTPIGIVNQFKGVIDGDGHTVSGVYIEGSSPKQGLFGDCWGGTIKNIGVVDSYIRGSDNVGGVLGYISSSINVINCWNSGVVIGSGSNVGGVVGNNGGLTVVQNCYNTGSVSGGGNYTGGVVGCYSGTSNTLPNCYNTGSVSGRDYVGGVVGGVFNKTVQNCYNTGSVSGNMHIGGVVGYSENSAKVQNCYNTGDVSGNFYIGGVTGSAQISTTIQYCYNAGSVSGGGAVSGVSGRADSSTVQNCYSTGSVSGSSLVGGVVGSANAATVGNCYYDKQRCISTYGIGSPAGSSGTAGKLTSEMVGTQLSSSLGTSSNWTFTSALYPRLASMDTTDAAYLSVSPITIQSTNSTTFETAASIYSNFTVSTVNGVSWTSSNTAVISISGDTATVTRNASDTVVTLTATKNNASRTIPLTVTREKYAVSAATNAVIANGVTAMATFGSSPYVAGATATVTITLSGTATAAGTHTIGLTSVKAGTITAPATVTKTVSSGNAPTDTFDFTFTMPANAVDDLVVTHTFVQAQSTAPAVTTATVAKSAATQAAVGFTLTSTPTGVLVYNVSTGGSALTTVTASVSGTTLTLTHATDIPEGTYYVSQTETGKTESTRLALTVGEYVAPTFAISASTNAVTANGVTATATFGSSSYAAGATATVTITLSGTATAAGAHTIGLTSVKAGTITAPATVTKTVSYGNAPTDTFDFTFTMPANAVDDLVVTHTFVQAQSTAPTVTTATVAKSAATQAAVNFTLNTALTGTWKVYNVSTGGSALATFTASVSDTTLTLTHAPDISPTTYYVSLTETGKTESTRLALTVGTYVAPTNSLPSGGNTTTPTTDTGANIIVNGKTIIAGTAVDTTENGNKITTVTVNEQKLEQKLAAEGSNALVVIPVNSGANTGIGELNGQMVKNMEKQQATLEIQTSSATYTLPASQINIDDVSKQLGTSVALSDIKVQIKIAQPLADTVKVVENAASNGGFSIQVPAVDFKISCTYNNQTVEVNSFNAYVERTIAIPNGVDHTKITTGVVVNADGTTYHVPTKVTIIDGKYYAVINSLTNSTYTVVWHPIEFKDVVSHWAKDAINNMGSRMIVNGVDELNYEPDRNITRAEFAAIVVRALGLYVGIGENSFSDVTSSAWYCGYVETAINYGIITGYGDGTFGPNDKITREQAMTIISRAMDITGLDVTLTDSEISTLLASYTDSSTASSYAKTGIAACLKTGIITGRSSSTVAPKDNITRAEVAVVVQRLLQKSNLI